MPTLYDIVAAPEGGYWLTVDGKPASQTIHQTYSSAAVFAFGYLKSEVERLENKVAELKSAQPTEEMIKAGEKVVYDWRSSSIAPYDLSRRILAAAKAVSQ